jgi:hypothetical protein
MGAGRRKDRIVEKPKYPLKDLGLESPIFSSDLLVSDGPPPGEELLSLDKPMAWLFP